MAIFYQNFVCKRYAFSEIFAAVTPPPWGGKIYENNSYACRVNAKNHQEKYTFSIYSLMHTSRYFCLKQVTGSKWCCVSKHLQAFDYINHVRCVHFSFLKKKYGWNKLLTGPAVRLFLATLLTTVLCILSSWIIFISSSCTYSMSYVIYVLWSSIVYVLFV